ncbi:MAG TPA: arginine--tRNA ligase [Desulfomonilaceae bacterium]|nr:arginine--tRNA ligase [Desulfomonilaceae bacterium]
MKEVVRTLIGQAIERAIRRNLVSLPDPGSVKIEVSRSKESRHGDYATNAALVLAGTARVKPRDLAEIIKDNLTVDQRVLVGSEVAGPGFINFFLAPAVWYEVLHTIHREKNRYGCAKRPEGPRILLEFVSANPTGPLHVGHGRGAAVGDTLARLLKVCGQDLQTEYYVNDAGNQMKILGRSLWIRYKQLMGGKDELPGNHYQGEYIKDLAGELRSTPLGDALLEMPEDEAVEAAAKYARDRILDGIKEDLAYFGVLYDSYFREKSLYETGEIPATLEELRARGKTEENEGALWFRMDGQQDEKDRVLVRATGEPTYFAADAAYHRNKFNRGFEVLVDIWGADHHGYVPRVRAAIDALGHDPNSLRVLLVQFVTLVREGEKISMSTRSGEFVTLREVLDEVGPDAARFFFLTKRCDSHLDFDLDLAKKQSRDNPVYYVQYAHARVASIFRIAEERNIDVDMNDPDLEALSLPEEQRIIKHLGDYPDMLSEAAEALEPHRITFYLMDLAEMFHAYYHDNRVLMEDHRVKKARLYLVEAVRQVIANGLGILGVTAPERM